MYNKSTWIPEFSSIFDG